jgi:hypothetical protein
MKRMIELMPVATLLVGAVLVGAVAVCLGGCDAPSETPAATSASSPPSDSPKTPPAKTAAPSASAVVDKPSHPCPDGSKGEGTRTKPCEAKGATRIMDVAWTGKTDDKGPKFRVTSKAKLEILYGNLVAYFYDKAGKQLEIPGTGKKPRKKVVCGGNIFAGPMKAGEKAVLTFSCVKKKHVPEGTAAIEAELQMVGFTDASGKKSDTFWRNDDLVPDERAKGGVK